MRGDDNCGLIILLDSLALNRLADLDDLKICGDLIST